MAGPRLPGAPATIASGRKSCQDGGARSPAARRARHTGRRMSAPFLPGARGPRLGAHVSIAGGLPLAVERACAVRCEAFQIFTRNTNQWRARPLPADEVAAFRARVREAGLAPAVAHASYLINVAARDRTLRRRSIRALAVELERAEALGLMGVVLHPGAHTDGTEADGLRRAADAVAEALAATAASPARLILEHTAGQGTSLGHRFEHLAAIIDRLDGSPRVGVCLDTCHLLAAGYDIRSEAGYADTFAAFERLIGLPRLTLFHLNDSKRPCGSRVDRHEHIGKGQIGLAPFRRLLHDPRFRHLAMLLETPKAHGGRAAAAADPMDAMNLRTLRRLRGRS